MAERSVSSGMLAPAPPMISARTAPTLIPFSMKTRPMGIMVSARMYIGMPMIAATGTVKRIVRSGNLGYDLCRHESVNEGSYASS
jgi:hypothetical protein